MKKKKMILFFISFIMFACFAVTAYSAPVLTLGVAAEKMNNTAKLNFGIANNTGAYAGVNAKIELPEGVSIKSVKMGNLLSSMAFSSHHYPAINIVTIIAYSTKYPISGDGVLFTLELDTANASDGTYPLDFGASSDPFVNSTCALSDENGNSVFVVQQSGYLAIGQTDTDNDGLPDALEQAIAGNTTGLSPNADYDGDGDTNWIEFHNMTDLTDFNSYLAMLMGDINDDEEISLGDAITALKILSGIPVSEVNLSASISGQMIGMADAIYSLQFAAKLRD